MELSRTHPSQGPSAGRSPWSAVERTAQSTQWRLVDLAHRCSLGRSPTTVRAIPNRPPAFPKLGTLGCNRKAAPDPGPAPQRGRGVRSQRMLRGRDLCSGQKRGRLVGKTKRGKGTKIMGIADSHGLPLALRTESASPAEVKLVKATLEERFVADVPERLIGDKAYDSDPLDQQLMKEYGTEMIAPNKINRQVATQDGRPLRRYAPAV